MRVVATLELTAKIGEFADGWNECGQHFAWTKAADELLAKVRRKETSRSGHLLPPARCSPIFPAAVSRTGDN
jgi:hypothetical protein